MTQMFIYPGHDEGDRYIHGAEVPPLPAIYQESPVIRTPRSAIREYSESELSTAAAMLQRLRDRRDVVDPLRELPDPTLPDHEGTIDRVVEKLLDIL